MKIEIGKAKNNKSINIDFNESHNVFIAGACGTGKSVLEHLMIKEISKHDSNATFVLIDSKHVEFYKYKNFKVFTDNNYRDELDRIIKDKTYNNVYVFFDEYVNNLFDDESINKVIFKLIEESKNRSIHTIVCSQKGGCREIFSKEFIKSFDAKIVLRLIAENESIYLLSNKDACKLICCGDAIILKKGVCERFHINKNE